MSFMKDFLVSREYRTKRFYLLVGIVMTAIGMTFAIPVFKGIGVLWTVASSIWTVLTVIRIIIKASDEDATAEDIRMKNMSLDGIEGERPDVNLYAKYDIDGSQEAKLIKLAKQFDNGKLSEEEYQKRRNEILQGTR